MFEPQWVTNVQVTQGCRKKYVGVASKLVALPAD
jgi:hypothetical protein